MWWWNRAGTAKLGEGAGCVGVYAAVDVRDGRQVAVKTVDRTREGVTHSRRLVCSAIELRDCLSTRAFRLVYLAAVDSTWKHSFQRELDIAIKLQHPNVIEIYDVIFWTGPCSRCWITYHLTGKSFAATHAIDYPFVLPRPCRYVCLVMEYASGGELFTQVANGGAMSEDRARQYFKQIVSAAGHCHSQGICHRDLKLENILLGADQASNAIRMPPRSHLASADTTRMPVGDLRICLRLLTTGTHQNHRF